MHSTNASHRIHGLPATPSHSRTLPGASTSIAFELIKFPIDEYPAMLVWYRKIEARPSFQRMVLDYERRSGNPFTDPQQIR